MRLLCEFNYKSGRGYENRKEKNFVSVICMLDCGIFDGDVCIGGYYAE